jgi:hypothetical protein
MPVSSKRDTDGSRLSTLSVLKQWQTSQAANRAAGTLIYKDAAARQGIHPVVPLPLNRDTLRNYDSTTHYFL